jgi:phosphoserine phosphatase
VASLESWNDGAACSAVVDFVENVDVDPKYRIAVFDNDGTLWCEKPAYAQALFILQRLGEQAAADPELAGRPVVKSLLAGDLQGAAAHGVGEMTEVLLNTHSGLTTEEFADVATTWFSAAKHPRFGVGFTDLTYVPMLELIDLLRANEFRVYIVSGGGVEFVRAISEDAYGVAPDDVVGSAVEVTMERRDGRVVLVRQAKMLGSANEGPPKTTAIQAHIGRRPIFAAGNSAGDTEMLEYTHTGDLPSLCLVVDHDDEEREYSYAGAAATNPNAEPIIDTAARFGWTVASMKNDWSRVFRHDGGG